MSGQQIGTVVGGIIGAYFGYPQLGMAIGGIIGGYVDPTKIKGPHIGQGQTQTATTGIPIAWVQGTAKIAGTIVAVGPRREVQLEDDGKGSGVVNVTFEARQDFAILICESSELRDSTIASVLMVEQDGKIVYDTRPDSRHQASSMKWASNVEFYFGAEDQLPPPTLEAIYGVGQTPGYRGVCLAVFKNFNVTAAGDRIPQFIFTVASAATSVSVDNVLDDYDVALDDGMRDSSGSLEMHVGVLDHSVLAVNGCPAIGDFLVTDTAAEPEFWAFGFLGLQGLAACKTTINAPIVEGTSAAQLVVTMTEVDGYFDWSTNWQYGKYPVVPDEALAWFDQNGLIEPLVFGNGIPFTAPFVVGTAYNTLEGIRYADFEHSDGVYEIISHVPQVRFALTGNRPLVRLGNGYWKDTSDGSLWRPSWVSAAGLTSSTPGSIDLATMVSRICKRGGLEDADFDTTALAGVSVDGYPIATVCTGTDALLPLLQAYFAYGSEYDGKIVFKFYGEDASITVDADDLILENADDSPIQSTKRNQATEFPQKVTVQYIDPAQNYNTNTQTAERLATTVIALGETTIQIPIAMSADNAVKAANKALKIAYATLEGTRKYSVPYATNSANYLTLCAGEPLLMDGKRWVLDDLTISDMALKLSTRYDRQSAYQSNVQAITGTTPGTPTSVYSGATRLMVMNLPSLRPQDTYGLYLAAQGFDESTWTGCTVQVSYDGKVSWQNAITMTQASIMGLLTEDETVTGGGDTRVDIGTTDSLESVTTAQLDARANAYAVMDRSGAAEIRQFQTATFEAAGSDWLLSDQSTGLLNTTHKDYAAGDQFTMLDSVYFLPINTSFSGKTLYFRAVGFGEVAEDATVLTIVYQPDTTVIVDGGTVTP